ncbi:MAG: leucine-rich repeat protein, partial [Lachnospiraceae bacterium]|nr:leucine-rich repeat protein [Lachnospiraceae bacterium]
MRYKKRIRQLSTLIAIFVLITNIMMFYDMKDIYSADTYTWRLNDKITVTLKQDTLTIAGTGAMPDMYDGQNSIPEWRKYCKTGNIKLVIQEGITSISSYAFFDCTGIKGNLKIPSTMTTIGEHAFENCAGLTGSLILPERLVKIGESAFKNCMGFNGGLIIPQGVKRIERYSFYGCRGFDNTLTISEGVECIGDYAFSGCSSFIGNLIIPDTVISIQSYAFSGCKSFNGILSISENVTDIETGAFSGCKSLRGNVVLPSGLTNIKNSTFSGCSGFDGVLIFPSELKTIGNSAFQNCSGLTGNLVIPDSVSAIGANAFSDCKNLNGSLKMPAFLKSIENGTFSGCNSLSGSLSIPSEVDYIGNFAFDGCSSLTGTLSLPEGISRLGAYAFQNCSGLSGSIVIPDSMTRIGSYTFSGCGGLTGYIEIPSGVKNIGENIILDTEINTVINQSATGFPLSHNTNLTYWTDADGRLLYSVASGTAYRKLFSATGQYSILASASQNIIAVGDKIKITAIAFLGSGEYQYKFIVWNKDNNEWIRLQDYSTKAECEFKPDIAGNYEVYVDGKDAVGKIVRSKAIQITAHQKELEVSAYADKLETVTGDEVKITAKGIGGETPYTYKIILHNKDTEAWSLLQDYSANSTYTWIAGAAGNREFFVDVKDASGKIVRSEAIPVTTYQRELKVSAYADKAETVTGDEVKITAKGIGGETPYTYKI